MRVSVHICTKDRFSEFAMLLQSLRTQTFQDWDLVIVDGSKPRVCTTQAYIQDIIARIRLEGHGVQLIWEDIPMGVCHARNRALSEDMFKNLLICRIDDDSLLEPDYLEKLHDIFKNGYWERETQQLTKKQAGERRDVEGFRMKIAPVNIGAVGGIVPPFGHANVYRNIKTVKPIFNRIEFDKDGNIKKIGDDGGYCYKPNEIIESHHLRSSFMFRRKVAEKIGGFPVDYGIVGFREETDFCMKMIMEGWKLLTDTSAICWHNRTGSGGVRTPDYQQQVMVADGHFRRKCRRWWLNNRLPKAMGESK